MLRSLITTALVAGPAVLGQSDMPLSPALQKIISDAASDPKYDYPTSLTRDIVPKAFHSHNDYWREVPFYSALKAGAVSVEADVWLYNGTLHVGHEQSALTDERTLDSLYIQPILSVLEAQNPNSSFVPGATKNGVYDTSSTQTLYLFVDLKTDGATTFPAVIEALQPLRDAGYLTTFDGTTVTQGPVTVIGTGNTPLNQVQGVAPRDYFWDAPIPFLSTIYANITSDVSPIASTNFNVIFPGVRGTDGLNDLQKVLLAAQVAVAHVKGIKVRYWDQPGWPVGTRNGIWRSLWEAGVDLLNVDDLEGAANFWESSG
ncbi:hypothetical protein J7T55_005715 [Diaporthe amygdali]|uniref:uncharacterized protein n=1 Tax=Phomopsis amygdali TaxID=1214568 RepID=UPI0022FF0F4F|nr:uncharacterized protein J7T55_005715 [Diaporthe amygdali]KAJ0124377.1 hypothetical protein J7T55_005715 [Diaporthe amygdali]